MNPRGGNTTQTAKGTYQHEICGSETLVRKYSCFHPSCSMISLARAPYHGAKHKTKTYSCASRPVDKSIHGPRRIVVDDRLHVGPIQAAGGHVRGDHHIVTVATTSITAALGQEFDGLESSSLCVCVWRRRWEGQHHGERRTKINPKCGSPKMSST